MRREISSVSCSLNCAGALRALLSSWIATSALLRPGRLLVPEKITSSMSAARRDLCEVSPMTQRSASTRFDLPQPFGPTTPVSPGSIRKSVGSTKDLKPSRRSRVSFMRSSFQAEKDQSSWFQAEKDQSSCQTHQKCRRRSHVACERESQGCSGPDFESEG